MSNESKAVDVMTALDAAANWMDDHPATSVTYSGDVRQARAAVAELMEAVSRYQMARLKTNDIMEFGGPDYALGSDWREASIELAAASCVMSAALKRCGGAS